MPTPIIKPTSALYELLAWSITRPDCVRDALRRIVVKGGVNDADLKELERICRAAHKADNIVAPAIAVEPLTKAHLPPAPGAAQSVSLVSIGALKHVNRLPSNQVIPFGPSPGLTVIYGDNGSGKSGYARVIKKACRARGVPPIIRADAFAPATLLKASAEIVFQVGKTDIPVIWTDGTSADPRLANVFVFDSFSAVHYVNDDNPAAFTPYGLDVLPVLSKTCDAIRESIERDINKKNSEIATVASNWKYDAATHVGKLVQKLSAVTKDADVDALCGLDSAQKKELHDLQEALKSDPVQKAKETRASAARLDTFANSIASTAAALADDAIEALRKLVLEVKSAEAAAKAFATGQFNADYLEGTGTALWRALWEAGREYSVSDAYKEQPFPNIENQARCVLCQQDLDDEAVKRLKAFEAFCTDKSQQLAIQLAVRLTASIENAALLQRISPELEKLDADLIALSPEQRAAVVAFSNNADARMKTVLENLKVKSWQIPAALPATPAAAVKDLCTALESRAKTEESASDPETRKKLDAKRSELDAREWLSGVKADVLAQIGRYKVVTKLERCKSDTSTAAITTKSTELTKQFVTDAFRLKFSSELKALGLRTLGVTLEPIHGKKGETKFGLRLTSAISKKVVDIASEGELRCVALAAFLAELSQVSHSSALVFDDPVSSLDHGHREKIAARIVEECKTRQVIVFTHDAVFLNDLKSYAERGSVNPEICYLEWGGNIPGRYAKGLPWALKSVEDRFDKLEKEQKEIARVWNPVPNEENVQSMQHAYSWLRASLERMIEKEIFSDVVFRFRSYIDVKKLNGVIGFTSAECDELQRLVQRCHNITEAHDPAQAKQIAVPAPTDLSADIAAAKQLLEDIRKRRKAVTSAQAPSNLLPAVPTST